MMIFCRFLYTRSVKATSQENSPKGINGKLIKFCISIERAIPDEISNTKEIIAPQNGSDTISPAIPTRIKSLFRNSKPLKIIRIAMKKETIRAITPKIPFMMSWG